MVSLTKGNTVSLQVEEVPQETSVKEAERFGALGTLAELNLGSSEPSEFLKERLRITGENAYRKLLARKRMENSVEAVVEVLGEMTFNGDKKSAKDILKYGTSLSEEQFKYTLEDSASSEMVDVGLTEEPMAEVAAVRGFEHTDLMQEELSKAQMTRTFADKWEAERESIGFVGSAVDFTLRMIPFMDTMYSNKLAGDSVDAFTNFGNTKETLEAVERMTPLQYGVYLEGLWERAQTVNPSFVSDFINTIMRGEKVAAANVGAIELLDASLVLAPIATLAKVATQSSKLAGVVGARKVQKQVVLEAVAKEEAGEVIGEGVDGILPSGLQTTEALSVGVPKEVSRALQTGQQSVDNTLATMVTERLTPEVRVAADLRATSELQRRLGDDIAVDIEDFNVSVDTLNQLRTVSVDFGALKGEGYASKASAKRSAVNTYKFKPGTFELIEDKPGLWYIRQSQHVVEKGGFGGLNAYKSSEFQKVGFIKRYVFSADSTSEEVTRRAAHMSVTARASIASEQRTLMKNLKGLKKSSRNKLELALMRSEADRTWMDYNQLKSFYRRQTAKDGSPGKPPTDKEILAYYTLKQLNDLDWHIRNSEVVKELGTRGYRKINLNAPQWKTEGSEVPFNGILREQIADAPDAIFYDASTVKGQRIVRGSSQANLERLKENGYKFIEVHQLDQNDPRFLGENVKYFMVKDEHFSDTILDPIQLAYVPGGHRQYATPWFVKQARLKPLAPLVEGQERFAYLRPYVHNAVDNVKEGRSHVEKLNKVQKVYNQAIAEEISEAIANRAIKELIPELDFATIKELADRELFDTIEPFVLMRDRELPPMNHVAASRFQQDDSIAVVDWYENSNRMYYGHKGARLPDINGNAAPLVDPFKTASRAINNASQLISFRNYQTKAVDRWVETLRAPENSQLLKDPNIRFGGSYEEFKDAVLNKNHPRADFMETQRQQINLLLNQRSATAERWEQRLYDLGESMNERLGWVKPGNFVIDHRSRDPLTAMRGFVFDAKLGFFDVSQLLLQTQTAVAAVTIDRVNGWAAMRAAPFLRMAILNDTDKLAEFLSKTGAKISGFTSEELTDMIHVLRNNKGIHNVGNELSILDDFAAPTVFNNSALRAGQTFREKGRMFFFEGERINKLVGFGIAYKRWAKANPGKRLTKKNGLFDAEALEEVIALTDTFSVNMTRASSAFWQKGLTAVPTQFASYQARLLELMLPQKLGGSKVLNATEKSRLAIGQIFLYGSAAIPPILGAQVLFENAVEDVVPGDNKVEELFQEGFYDAIVFPTIFGDVDTDFASRAGLFGNASLITDMWDPDAGLWDVAGGAVVSTGSDVLDALSQMSRLSYIQNTNEVMPITLDILADLVKTTSSMNRADKAVRSYLTQYHISKSGRVITDVNPMEAVLTGFGIPLKRSNDYYEAVLTAGSIKRRESKIAKEVRGLNADAMAKFSRGDFEGGQRKLLLAAAILRIETGEDPIIMDRIRRAAMVDAGPAWVRAYQDLLSLGQIQQAERLLERQTRNENE